MTPDFTDAFWETKGRGMAVFACGDDSVSDTFRALSGTWVSPADGSAHVPERVARVLVPRPDARMLSDAAALDGLLSRVIRPAYWHRIPLYITLAGPVETFTPRAHPFGTLDLLEGAQPALMREQLWNLLRQMCIVFPTPDAMASGGERATLVTPVQKLLAEALAEARVPYEAQTLIGGYVADFAIPRASGKQVVVEADGRELSDSASRTGSTDCSTDRSTHDPGDDSHDVRRGDPAHHMRDAGPWPDPSLLTVLHFTGSEICASPGAVVAEIVAHLSGPRHDARTFAAAGLAQPTPVQLEPLSEEQERCLRPLEGVVMTLAPAGSGKTRVLARRVVEAAKAGVKQKRILAVVFNVDARSVMQKRIQKDAALSEVEVRTLHSLGYLMLVTNGPLKGYQVELDERRIDAHYRRAIGEVRAGGGEATGFVSSEAVNVFKELDSVYKRTLTVGELSPGDDGPATEARESAAVREAVARILDAERRVTFDDLIFRAVELLLTDPRARQRWQSAFDVVLVDEFQDLTPMQVALVRLLAMPLGNLFVVGDDDQMINSFASADPRNVRNFAGNFAGATVHTLGENYRCARSIVEASGNLISHNRVRFQKPIRSSLPPTEESFRVVQDTSLAGEIDSAVRTLQDWHKAGIAYREMAVLVRVSSIASPLMSALDKAGVACDGLEAPRFYTSGAGRTIGAYMRLCGDPEAATAGDTELALRTPTQYFTKAEMPRLTESGWKSLVRTRLGGYKATRIREFIASLRQCAAYAASGHSAAESLNHLIQAFALDKHYRKLDKESSATDVTAGADLIDIVKGNSAGYPTFKAFVDYYTEQQEIEEARAQGGRSVGARERVGVQVKTIHKAKGDEFTAVVLLHVAEGTLPHSRAVGAKKEAAMEEERRICYVGVTRAIERLVVTTEKGKDSRFLKEMLQPRPASQTPRPKPKPRDITPAPKPSRRPKR